MKWNKIKYNKIKKEKNIMKCNKKKRKQRK